MLMKYMDLKGTKGIDAIVLQGIPYDGTASYKPGSRFAPAEVRNNSLIGFETYSPILNKDLEDINVLDVGDINVNFANPKETIIQIYEQSKYNLSLGSKLVSIGGEHSITFGIVLALYEKYPNLKVIQFDAHTDLREEYLGSEYSHASVMKRICDLIGSENVYQLGIRSGTKEEYEYSKENTNFYPNTLNDINQVISKVKDSPVYISIDQDVLDPAFFPGTGTPEPGGVLLSELFEAVYSFKNIKNIIGFDLVELNPLVDESGISSAVTIKLLREMLLML